MRTLAFVYGCDALDCGGDGAGDGGDGIEAEPYIVHKR